MKNKLYVLIDKNLDPIYGAVQGGHAVAEYMMYTYNVKYNKFACEYEPHWNWENDYLIYISVDIDYWETLLRHYGVDSYVEFDEPDLNYKTTAMAVLESDLPDILKTKIENENLLRAE